MKTARRFRARLPFHLFASLILAAVTASATVFEVANNEYERFQEVVSTPVGPETARAMRTSLLVELGPNGERLKPVAAILDRQAGKAVLTWVLPGITPPGATRRFAVVPRNEVSVMPAPPADLEVTVTKQEIRVHNAYFALAHPRHGGGGFPGKIRFRLSGHDDPGLYFLDRLFKRENRKQFFAYLDPNASAKVIFQSPLRVVVEARFRYYLRGAEAPGKPRAVYRYTYTPFSPVIEVEADIVQDENTAWDELHFLHLSRKSFHYTSFVTGEPPKETPMLKPGEKSRSIGGRNWGLMATDTDAAGVAFGPVSCWDAADEFVYYTALRQGRWKSRSRHLRGGVYLGPAAADTSWYSRWLGPDRKPAVRVLNHAGDRNAAAMAPPLDGSYELRNRALRLVFGNAKTGYDCLGIENLETGKPVRFVFPHEKTPGLWQLEFRTPWHKPAKEDEAPQDILILDNRCPAAQTTVQRRKTSAGETVIFSWRGIDLDQEKEVLDVTATVHLNPDSGDSEWRLAIDNRSKRFGLWEARYPCLTTVAPRGDADVLAPRGNWGGTLYRGCKRGFTCSYPSGAGPVQFIAFNRGNAGLYVGAHDGAARKKEFRLSGAQDFTIATCAENMGVPGSDRAMPFPVVIAACNGDWWQAARRYRAWALRQAWTAKGPIRKRHDVPKQFRELGLWFLGGGAPGEVMPWMTEAGKRCDIPIGLHWYSWHQIPFDNSYPNYFPAKEGFADAVRTLTGQGDLIMPYINGRLWDRDIPSFAARGIRGACKQPNGEPYTEVYGSGRRLAPMCPTTRLWQDTLYEICRRLIHECGVNGIYLDQIGAARPALCFDPAHHHPLGGGRHWVDGYRVLLNRIKKEAAANHVALTTENTAEPYMDNIDGFLAWSPRFDIDVPLLPAVYSGYTIYFTSPQDPADDLKSFVMAQGRDFLWGCQLGWNHKWLLDPSHRDKLEFELALCRLRLAAKDFLVYGTLLDEIRPTRPLPGVTGLWHRRTPHPAILPAIQGTLWRDAQNRLAVFLINYDNEPHTIHYSLRPNDRLPPNARDNTWLVERLTARGVAPWQWREGAVIERADTLAPHELRAFILTGAKKSASRKKLAAKSAASRFASDPVLRTAFASFRLEEALARKKLRLVPPRSLQQVVRGEPTTFTIRLENRGKKTGAVTVVWPDGKTEKISAKPKSTAKVTHFQWIVEPEEGTARVAVKVKIPGKKEVVEFPVTIDFIPALEVEMGSLTGVRGGESFLLPIQVRNHSRARRDACLVLEVPDGWRVEPAPTADLGSLAPGAERSLLLKCSVPPAQATRRESIAARIIEHAVETEVEVKKSRPLATAIRLKKAPKIDGKLGEFAAAPILVLDGKHAGAVKFSKTYGGADDCSAQVRFGWDKRFLYLAAVVRDNVLHQEESGPTIWRGDCIQLAFRNGPPNRETGYDGSEYELGLTLSPGGPLLFQWMPGKRPLENGKLAVVRDKAVTRYEAAIPWKAIGITDIRSGKRMSWSMTVNDNDGKGFRGWLEWTPGVCGGKDSSAFGWLTLTTPETKP